MKTFTWDMCTYSIDRYVAIILHCATKHLFRVNDQCHVIEILQYTCVAHCFKINQDVVTCVHRAGHGIFRYFQTLKSTASQTYSRRNVARRTKSSTSNQPCTDACAPEDASKRTTVTSAVSLTSRASSRQNVPPGVAAKSRTSRRIWRRTSIARPI